MITSLSLISELKRRNVFRVVAAYLVATWLVVQVVETLFPIYGLSNAAIRLVVTLLAIGLLPVTVFSWAFELTPEGLKKDKDVNHSRSITEQTGKKLDRVIMAVLAIALGYFVFDKFGLSPSREAELVESTTQIVERKILSRAPDKSIAVLPFVNMSSDPDQEFFSDGISEEILNVLAQVRELKVAGRTSSFAFKGRKEDLREIGELLNVAHILEGSVRKAGNQIRVTAQLINVDDGYHVWSETFDRELTDVFAIQDEIAIAILDQLKTQLLGEATRLMMTKQTDTEVYELYLQARQLIYEREQKSMELALRLLERGLTLDPDYAPAHAQLGIVLLLLSERNYGDIPHEEASTLAHMHLDTAVELDSNLAEAWAGLGLYHQSNLKPSNLKAAEALEKALSINPNLLDALAWMNVFKKSQGDLLEALAINEKILELDPLYLPAINHAILAYNWSGQAERSWHYWKEFSPSI